MDVVIKATGGAVEAKHILRTFFLVVGNEETVGQYERVAQEGGGFAMFVGVCIPYHSFQEISSNQTLGRRKT